MRRHRGGSIEHGDHSKHLGHGNGGPSLNRLAVSATVHCLTGCGFGEILGIVIGSALGWGTVATIALAVALAFFFGYSLILLPLLRAGLGLRDSVRIALAAEATRWSTITMAKIRTGLFARKHRGRGLKKRGKPWRVVLNPEFPFRKSVAGRLGGMPAARAGIRRPTSVI
jgi:hypothetical protein